MLLHCTSADRKPTVTAAPTVDLTVLPTAEPESAPDFQLTTLDGTSARLADFRGRHVLINFWATWCLPCRQEMPYLQQVAERYPDHVVILAVNMRETPGEVGSFVDEYALTFPILLQPDNEMVLAYSVRGLPLTVMINPDGKLIYRQIGPLEPNATDALLAKLLP